MLAAEDGSIALAGQSWPCEFILQNWSKIKERTDSMQLFSGLCAQLSHAFIWLISLWSFLFLCFLFFVFFISDGPASESQGCDAVLCLLSAFQFPSAWLQLISFWVVMGVGLRACGQETSTELYPQCEFDIDKCLICAWWKHTHLLLGTT